MVRPEDILEMLRATPFEPFRVYLTDGAVYEVRHPDRAIGTEIGEGFYRRKHRPDVPTALRAAP